MGTVKELIISRDAYHLGSILPQPFSKASKALIRRNQAHHLYAQAPWPLFREDTERILADREHETDFG